MKSLNKTLSLVLVFVMVFGILGSAGAAFTDLGEVRYTEAVEVMAGIGAVNGYADGSFNPKGTITREEAAKMITYAILGPAVASKLSVSATGFTDVDAGRWSAPFIAYCVSKGIINGMGNGTFEPAGNVTGYQVAKMMLCAIGYGKQNEYVGASWELNVAIDANKYGVFANSKATGFNVAATREETALYVFNALTGTKAVQVDYDKTKEKYDSTGNSTIGFELYNLKAVANSTDDFGRPASVWTYGANDKKISSVVAAPVATFTKGFTSGDLYKALGVVATDIMVTVSSKDAQTDTTKINAAKNGTDNYAGTGIVTEVYKTSNTPTFVAVQIVPSFAKVDNIVSTKATAAKGAYNTYTVGALSGIAFTSIVDAEEDVNTAIVTGTVEKGDMVLYYQDGEGNLYINAVNTISGLLTSITSEGVVTVGSTQTAKAAAFTGAELAINAKQEQTFYVDSYGYILGVKEAAPGAAKIAMVIGLDTFSELKNGKIVTTYAAIIANLDGSVATVVTDKDSYDNRAALVGSVCDYTVSTTAVYSFTASDADTAVTAVATKSAELVTDTLYANNATKFVVADFKTNEAGARVPTGTVTIYTGINSVPTFAALSKAAAVDLLPVGSVDKVAEVVFIYDDVKAVAADTYVYVVGTFTQTAKGYVYDTIVKGQPSTITVATAGLTAKTLYSEIKLTGTNITTATPAATTVDKIGNVGNLLFTSTSDNYGYASKSIADDVPVFTIYTTSGTVAVGTGADLVTPVEATDAIYVVYNPANPAAVAAVYIVVAA